VNHIEGHIYANWLTDGDPGAVLPAEPSFPLLCLVVSGGHTQLVLMHDHGRYELLGQTVDDAAGEAFDKVGRLLGLPYPGGPAISAAAVDATPATRFPRARTEGPYDFSFSGLKTAVLREVEGYRERGEPIPVDGLAAAFEEAVVDALTTKTVAAARDHGVASVALGGGVAANRALRATLGQRLATDGLSLLVPRPEWCTDNGAMIGAAAGFRFAAGDRADASLEAVPNLALPWLQAG
jgi:N6-L-threonylcarbamoyladenine synthase